MQEKLLTNTEIVSKLKFRMAADTTLAETNPANNSQDLQTVQENMPPRQSGNVMLIVGVAAILIVAGLGAALFLSKSSSTPQSQNSLVNNVNKPADNSAASRTGSNSAQPSTLETDVQGVDTDLSALDRDLSDVNGGLSDKQGDLSEQ